MADAVPKIKIASNQPTWRNGYTELIKSIIDERSGARPLRCNFPNTQWITYYWERTSMDANEKVRVPPCELSSTRLISFHAAQRSNFVDTGEQTRRNIAFYALTFNSSKCSPSIRKPHSNSNPDVWYVDRKTPYDWTYPTHCLLVDSLLVSQTTSRLWPLSWPLYPTWIHSAKPSETRITQVWHKISMSAGRRPANGLEGTRFLYAAYFLCVYLSSESW